MANKLIDDTVIEKALVEVLKYFEELHKRAGNEKDNTFKAWGRPLYKTGRLYISYNFKKLIYTDKRYRALVYNKAPYSQFLNENWPHVYSNDKVTEIIQSSIEKDVQDSITLTITDAFKKYKTK